MSSLLKLTADYTDSEDEDNKDEPQHETSNPPSNARMSSRASSSNQSPTGSAMSLGVNSASGTPVKKPSLNKLVSYGDPDEEDNENSSSPNKKNDSSIYEDSEMKKESDDEQERNNDDNDSESNQAVPMDLGTTDEEDNKDDNDTERPKNDNLETSAISERGVEVEAWTGGGQLPPEPSKQCDPKLQEMVNRAYKKTKEEGYDMNATIQNKKKFRNPSIYERLIEFCDIDEMGTNFPKDLYDGHLYGPESYYDQLAKEQNAALEKQRKAAEKRKAEVPVLKSSSSAPALSKDGEAAKRRSKWDQGGNQVAVPPATLIGNPNAAAAAAVAAQVAKKISSIGPLRR